MLNNRNLSEYIKFIYFLTYCHKAHNPVMRVLLLKMDFRRENGS